MYQETQLSIIFIFHYMKPSGEFYDRHAFIFLNKTYFLVCIIVVYIQINTLII